MTTTDRNTAQAQRLLRFHQPEKLLRHLGPLDEPVLAALFGTDAGDYRGRLEEFEERNREAAATLSAEPDTAARIAALPFRPGEHVVALGESTTADRLSWFEILRHLLPKGVRCTNLAVSGSTTAQALTQQLPALGFQRPDWVLCMLGANDVQRIDGVPLVGRAETCRNLIALHDLAVARTGARWVWLTPTHTDPDLVDGYEHFRRAGLSWSDADLDAVADFLLARPEPVVDTRRAVRGHHEADGLHLTPSGQSAVTAALLETLGP
ncbi:MULTISPECIES: SGNH/GDSL hydrolase family protein [unclassified Streptomyces]|uniref:SGNH/GDSL hydrolase family protein n=1 Tax=unclassified Streptomyces TaxID=2593676 RepID=UPI002E2B7A16|nr:SGNH/GDSL hydrolase family protein [Streptomyces sp. NBC_01439]